MCCDRDCDPDTSQSCRMLCPPVPPPDPICTCDASGTCRELACSHDTECKGDSHCDGSICIRDQRCLTAHTGCKAAFDTCDCVWRCIDADTSIEPCNQTCPDQEAILLLPPQCECGEGGCGMVPCSDPLTCGWETFCQEVPGSAAQTVCVDCLNCD
jgi:hypothetical protein